MQLIDIAGTIQARLITSAETGHCKFERAFSSDLMSDVLTLNSENLLLITGLNNLQTIRTAEMAEIKAILFARNKVPTREMIDLANKEGIALLVTDKSMFHASGLLFQAGLKPVF